MATGAKGGETGTCVRGADGGLYFVPGGAGLVLRADDDHVKAEFPSNTESSLRDAAADAAASAMTIVPDDPGSAAMTIVPE